MVMSNDSIRQDNCIRSGAGVIRSLFLFPSAGGKMIARAGLHKDILELTYDYLLSCADEDSDGALDYANALAYDFSSKDLAKLFAGAAFDRLAALGALKSDDSEWIFTIKAMLRVGTAFKCACEWLQSAKKAEISPRTWSFIAGKFPETAKEMDKLISECDPFVSCRSFLYRQGAFIPAKLDSTRSINGFFGFESIRHLFADQLKTFSEGKSNVPFMVSSLPGHGKTQLAIANTLKHSNLTLILPAAETLSSGLAGLFEVFRRRADRRFVVFFDDIVPDEIDWFDFRTQVGGALTLPDNVQVIIASNYQLPPNILSRGRDAKFPVFDEIRCTEMIEDFLHSCGMNKPTRKLVGVIGAYYCEEFGQKTFTELSPRTLMRYLDRYKTSTTLRKKALEASQEELVPRPDSQLFYEFNVELMRRMYGEEYIQQLLKEQLKSLERG